MPTYNEFKAEWLAELQLDELSSIDKGRKFSQKLIFQWLDISEATDDLVFCDGSGDGGIDIAFLYRGTDQDNDGENTVEGHKWYLIQSKYGTAFQGVSTLLAESIKVIETLEGRRPHLNSLAEGLVEQLTNFRRQASDLDQIILVFATGDPLDDRQKQLLSDIRAMGRNRLGGIFDVESISIETIYNRSLEEPPLSNRILIPLQADLVPSGEGLMVGSTSLTDLYDFLKSYRNKVGDLDQIYEKNVRRFLGSRGKVNKGIRETLRDNPDKFGLYNNGITIVVPNFTKLDTNKYELVEPYIVNGCQTTRTIWEVFHSKLEAGGTGIDPDLQDWRTKASHGIVVLKVVKVGADGENMLEAITRFTNSQNAVREKDFLALDSDFKNWRHQMSDKYNVYLEIQRGGWDSQRALQRQTPQTKQFTEYANAFDLLKIYAAGWLQESGIAFGKNTPFLPNGTLFKKITSPDLTEPFSVDDLYAAYRLMRKVDEYKFGRGAINSRRQTRYLYYQVAVDLLKDILSRVNNLLPNQKDITNALLKLFRNGNEEVAGLLFEAAIQVIDEYFLQTADDCIYNEPSFINTFISDLNAFLKWDQLGKTESSTPRLRSLLHSYKRQLGRIVQGRQSDRELLIRCLQSE